MKNRETNPATLPVTAVIPSGNEERQIQGAIESLLWAEDILIVLDAAATDSTAAIAASVDPRVRLVIHEYGYSAAQKNYAIPLAKHPWVFLLDADERVTPELEEEIRHLFNGGEPDSDAYWIKRRNILFGRVMRHGGQQTDKVIRLFRRECRYQDRRVHAEIEGWGSIGHLENHLLHDTFRGWKQYLDKLDRYTTWGAEQDFRDGGRSGFPHVVLRPAGRFFKQYVIRLGFLDGIPGAISAFFGVFGVFLKYAKLWDMARISKNRLDTRDGEAP